ncbi:MAG: ATP-binding cassette domain-containing protein, partial [Candidatus Hodarchaeales archaeon]
MISANQETNTSIRTKVSLENVNRVYRMGEHDIHALKDISMSLETGNLVVVLGPSGSGKTTLLNVLGA